jgi:hypothetical protein
MPALPVVMILGEGFTSSIGGILAWLGARLLGFWMGNPEVWKPKEPTTYGYREYIFFSILMLFYVVIYARGFVWAYETIPARWGGGTEVSARLLFDDEGEASIHKAGLFTAATAGISVRLLLLTDEILVVSSPGSVSPVLILPRNDVKGIILRRPEPGSPRKRPTAANDTSRTSRCH